MIRQTYFLHALSPLHAGTGQGVDIVDLPIARMQSTGIPIVPGSGVKGALRDRLEQSHAVAQAKAVFGPSLDAGDNPSEHAGALVVGDARLLALPVRALRGVFGWVSSPLLLTLAARDLGLESPPVKTPAIPTLKSRTARVPTDTSALLMGSRTPKVFLQDLDLSAAPDSGVKDWAAQLSRLVFTTEAERAAFEQRFVVVDDETMAFLWQTATQVDARNRIDNKTGTVVDGALWYEESLPPESLLVGSVAVGHVWAGPLQAKEVLDAGLPHDSVVQFGGKATVGRGICRVLRPGGAN